MTVHLKSSSLPSHCNSTLKNAHFIGHNFGWPVGLLTSWQVLCFTSVCHHFRAAPWITSLPKANTKNLPAQSKNPSAQTAGQWHPLPKPNMKTFCPKRTRFTSLPKAKTKTLCPNRRPMTPSAQTKTLCLNQEARIRNILEKFILNFMIFQIFMIFMILIFPPSLIHNYYEIRMA